MGGFKEANTAMAITIQPVPGTYNEPTIADLIAIYDPDHGSDAITAEDATMTGAVWGAPRQFLGRRGRAGATLALRGPGGAVPPGAGLYVPGRIYQAAGFTEIINPTAITGTATGGTINSLNLAAAMSAVDDFYMGYPIMHPNIGAGRVKGMSVIRDYIGATKTAVISETLAAAIAGGDYTIPAFLAYVLSTAASVPLLSCKVWRHKKAYRYKDCAISSFAINIPTSNDETTDVPTIEFAMVGKPAPSVDELAPTIPSSLLTPTPPAKDGKFAFNGIKVGHQSLRIEFGMENGAPPNVNFEEGQEPYELLSATRTVTADLNEQLKATLDLDALVDGQAVVPIHEAWGSAAGRAWSVSVHNSYLDPFNPTPRNGFIGVQGGAAPIDADRAIALTALY